MSKQQRRTFTSEFKKQMVQLYENGKPRAAIVEEYDLKYSCELRIFIKVSRGDKLGLLLGMLLLSLMTATSSTLMWIWRRLG
ncbi:transposase [Paenibacillus sp. M-152]|uniref:transposase n=1 Tax=Paenibacillus sp. M-152 TaxID=2487928 RepID=UPI000F71A0E0|nr:transposase [Paenibacillus sp. M-152]AZH29567.1 transposase [Paenibacillus sp. M-152]